MFTFLREILCGKRPDNSKYESLNVESTRPDVDVRKVNTAVNVVKLFLPDCLNIDDVLESRDELKKLAQARCISKLLAKSAAAIQMTRGIKCPKGAEDIIRQTIVDNGTVFKALYSVLTYLYLSPGSDIDGILDQVAAQTTDRTMMLGDISVIAHAMRIDGNDKTYAPQDLLDMGLGTFSGDSVVEPIELVNVLEAPHRTQTPPAAIIKPETEAEKLPAVKGSTIKKNHKEMVLA
ncbi:Tegument protein UL51 [Cacatuid alphaherpesvirus 2]|uniref:Tegument protein UL51 n=1 Tax=Cacatuid alphaherpesvirus 2 TaxID=2604840 RepID=A0A5B9R414_9ALPH|nr:Tegument protein UL51 [Cacatuid alphaherpesvirus 2]QEG54099.1 Tegument protein UL51 [Cacatuid alphaherpesvirus 2]